MPEIVTPDVRSTRKEQPSGIIGRPLRIFAWLSFIAEVIIIGTGGAVRLTGSGLGCSDWPLCTPESLVPIYEVQGIHGIIEFGNRTMTGVVGLLAIAVLLLTLHTVGGRRSLQAALWFALAGLVTGGVFFAVALLFTEEAFPFFTLGLILVTVLGAVHSLRITPIRRDLTTLAWIVLIGVVAQAFVGGITVLTGLNPFIVGFHYASSLALVCVTAAFLIRMREPDAARVSVVPRWFSGLSQIGRAHV